MDDDFNSEKIKGINIKITKLQNNVHQLKDDLELLLNPHDTIKNILQSINRTHDIDNRYKQMTAALLVLEERIQKLFEDQKEECLKTSSSVKELEKELSECRDDIKKLML